MNNKLTDKQQKLITATKKFINQNGYSPTVRELCKLLKKNSPATIKAMLDILVAKGYISYIPGKARTIKVYDEPTKIQNERKHRV